MGTAIGSLRGLAFFAVLASLLLGWPATGIAQSGIPGGRLESGRDHRAAVRAEAYRTVALFYAEWREAWNSGDTARLLRQYSDDAIARLPGQTLVRGGKSLKAAVRTAMGGAPTLSMSDIDFDSDGERSILVARYVLRRDGRLIEGIMTSMLFRVRSSWRLRVQIFDAPEVGVSIATTMNLVALESGALVEVPPS